MAERRDAGGPEGFLRAERARRAATAGTLPEHFHDFYEVYLYIGGGMTHFIGNQNYRLKENDIMLVDRQVFHSTSYPEAIKNHERILLSFDARILGLIAGEAARQKVTALFGLRKLQFAHPADHQWAANAIVRLYETFSRGQSELAGLRCRLQLCELLLSLADLMERGLLISEVIELNTPERRVADVIGYLDANYPSSLTLEGLARQFYVGKFTLCHEFKKMTGITVVQYINRKRLAEAGRMLAEPQARVTEVAQLVGFNSLSHFNEQFRLSFGCPPTEYRNRILKKQ